MLDFLQTDLQRKSETFGQLTIERRVLITPSSIIPIANIAIVSLGAMKVPRKPVWNLALAFLAAGLVALVAGINLNNNLATAIGGVGMLSGLILARFLARTEVPCLSIISNGGQASLFTGQRRTLEEVRRLLSDKINAGDESAAYRVNFEKGAIQALSVAHDEPIGAMLAGSTAHVAVSAGHPRPLEPFMPTLAPGPQLGNSYSGAPHVDYSQILPQIVDMQRFYAQRQDTQDVAERLNELEYLMRSGTPTTTSRSRLNQLVGELSSMLGAYPGVVQILQHAARLAGV